MARHKRSELSDPERERQVAWEGVLNIVLPGRRVGDQLEALADLSGIPGPSMKNMRYGRAGISAETRSKIEKALAKKAKEGGQMIAAAVAAINLDHLMSDRGREDWEPSSSPLVGLSQASTNGAASGSLARSTGPGQAAMVSPSMARAGQLSIDLGNGTQVRIGNGVAITVANLGGQMVIDCSMAEGP